MEKEFTIRKRIAKHGENSIIVIPKLLRGELGPSTIVELKITVLEEAKDGFWPIVSTVYLSKRTWE